MSTPVFHRYVAPLLLLFVGGCFDDPATAAGTDPDPTTSDTAEGTTGSGISLDDPASSSGPRSGSESGTGDSDGESGGESDGDPDDGGTLPPPMPGACTSDLDCGPGRYCASTCLPFSCGDALVHGSEQCDDGNVGDGDGCDSDCTYTEVVIDVSWHNTCALIEGGRVRCWGDGADGRLGYGNSETLGDDEQPWEAGDVDLPVPLDHLHSGDTFACGLTGTDVLCWGDASGGAIGSGSIANLGDDELLVALAPVALGEPTTRLTVGGSHSCASGASGQVRCWGAGAAVGYGTGLVVGDDELPEAMGSVSIGAAIVDMSAGIRATCVVQTDGAVRCWGSNDQGQLGLGHTDAIGDDELPSSVTALAFPEDAVQVAAGDRHTCARFVGGGVRCWGANAYGELGRGDEVQQGDDELVVSLPLIGLGEGEATTFITAGDNHTCALLESGGVQCWGRNSFGQLGNGSFEHVGDDELPMPSDVVDLPAGVIQLDAGGNHTCAVLEDYRVFCWGRNGDGQLGLGHAQDVALPLLGGAVPVLGPTDRE